MVSGTTTFDELKEIFLPPKHNIVGETKEKRVYTIKVDKLNPEDVDNYIKELQEKFKLGPNDKRRESQDL